MSAVDLFWPRFGVLWDAMRCLNQDAILLFASLSITGEYINLDFNWACSHIVCFCIWDRSHHRGLKGVGGLIADEGGTVRKNHQISVTRKKLSKIGHNMIENCWGGCSLYSWLIYQ